MPSLDSVLHETREPAIIFLDKDGHEIMPVPKTREERIIHECDYFASRNFLNVHFIDNEIADSAERGKVFQKKENEVTN